MSFIAIDLETANEDYASICQVGIACFEGGELVKTYSTLVNPKSYFSGFNVAKHGIEQEDVGSAPTFNDIYATLRHYLEKSIVVHHTAFDRVALNKAIEKNREQPIQCHWLDSARVVRRTWNELSQRGYKLKSVAQKLGIEFEHHDALEDARAAGLIMLHAIKESGVSIEEWLQKVERPISERKYDIERDGKEGAPLFGEIIVFTGALSVPRREAADIASNTGCEVDRDITKKTTILVVGDQDIERLRQGETKSSKHLKAEKLIKNGQPIRVINETSFWQLVEMYS